MITVTENAVRQLRTLLESRPAREEFLNIGGRISGWIDEKPRHFWRQNQKDDPDSQQQRPDDESTANDAGRIPVFPLNGKS